MNGAHSLLATLYGGGVDTVFANPGTSELHPVDALDGSDQVHGVLTLFEGVATGAADGYGRVAGVPAATLLHLGPGLGNGWANLHNARRAGTPVLNVVGDHATWHGRYDAPLESDIAALAGACSRWVRRTSRAADLGPDAAEGLAAAAAGGVATLIVPADASWDDGGRVGTVARPVRPAVEESAVTEVAAGLTAEAGPSTLLLLGGSGTTGAGLAAAAAIVAATGSRMLSQTFPSRMERGAGRAPLQRLAYFPEMAGPQLAGVTHLVLAGAAAPVAFFAHPTAPSSLVPEGCRVTVLAPPGADAAGALVELARRVAPGPGPAPAPPRRPDLPDGPSTPDRVADVIGALLPDGAIVVDESLTSGSGLARATAGAPPHDWLSLTGGAIGWGLPAATGAAVAGRGRPVLCLESDGSAMYTISALWTQAREQLDVTTVVYANRSYAILGVEAARLGLTPTGPGADLLDLARPELDFVALAAGMGVPARRCDDAAALAKALTEAFAEPGPHLVQVDVPGG